MMLHIENYEFPYYRSRRNNGHYDDAVLVKDIGISCTLLDKKENDENLFKYSTIGSYLVKQLKSEYKDLSQITKRFSAYTKDIFSNLSIKEKFSKKVAADVNEKKHVFATEYLDENGNPCLKLRLYDDIKIKEVSPNSEITVVSLSSIVGSEFNTSQNLRNNSLPMNKEKQFFNKPLKRSNITKLRQIKLDSRNSNDSFDNHYSTINPNIKTTNMTKVFLTQLHHSNLYSQTRKNSQKHTNCHVNKNSVIYTNWKEISRSAKSNILNEFPISKKLQCMSSKKMILFNHKDLNNDREMNKYYLYRHHKNNNFNKKHFHTFNVRIIKQNCKR